MNTQIPQNINVVIFDMDGLLIDSEPFWFDANTKLLAKRGKEYTTEIFRKVVGKGEKEIMELFKAELGISGEIDDLIKERKEYLYESLLKNLVAMEGAGELIEKLSKKYKLAIATGGHSEQKAREILQALSIDTYFPIIVTSGDVKRGKPYPDIYLLTAEKLHVSPKDCLVMEDAVNGVEAAKAAGMMVFGINKDPWFYSKLQEAGANKVFKYLSEITI